MAKALAKGSRITGAQRETLAAQYAKRYAAGDSIRKIAEAGMKAGVGCLLFLPRLIPNLLAMLFLMHVRTPLAFLVTRAPC